MPPNTAKYIYIMPKRKINKNSTTGKFVSDSEVKSNPKETYTQTITKPPIGIYPRKLWLEDRRTALTEAVERKPKAEIVAKYQDEISWIDAELTNFVGLNYQQSEMELTRTLKDGREKKSEFKFGEVIKIYGDEVEVVVVEK